MAIIPSIHTQSIVSIHDQTYTFWQAVFCIKSHLGLQISTKIGCLLASVLLHVFFVAMAKKTAKNGKN
jgi:hypothetical protein